jgi:hypothetical protein
MKTKKSTPGNYNSAFVNVTLSAKLINGKFPIMDLLKASTGDWVMTKESAEKIEYLYPVRKNQILGVFKVQDYKMVTIDGQTRARFTLKPIYEGSTRLTESALSVLTSTNYVVKYFES